jgi:biotin carboxyl carrier protein
MAKVIAQGKSFDITQEKEELTLNESDVNIDLSTIDGKQNLIYNGKSYNIQIIEKDAVSGKITLKINGRKIETQLQNNLHLLLKKMGMNQGKKKQNEVKAPMPGLVLDILVQENQEVQEGEVLLVLEAMKMENAIKSPMSGTVESISIKKGQTVDKNQLMIKIK